MDIVKKYLITLAVIVGILILLYSSIVSGMCEDFILSNAESAWAPGALYHIGNLFLLFQADYRAEIVFEDFINTFKESSYDEMVYYKYYMIISNDYSRKKEALKRGREFLKLFPESAKTDIVKNSIDMID